jgi:hypothetical protein
MGTALKVVLLAYALSGCTKHEKEATVAQSHPQNGAPLMGQGRSHDTTTVCLLRDGDLRVVLAERSGKRGDSLIVGEPADHVFRRMPPPFGDEADWFRQREPIVFKGRAFYWNGSPLVLSPDSLAAVGNYRGVTLYTMAEDAAEPGILLFPTEPGCELQPYYHLVSGAPDRQR